MGGDKNGGNRCKYYVRYSILGNPPLHRGRPKFVAGGRKLGSKRLLGCQCQPATGTSQRGGMIQTIGGLWKTFRLGNKRLFFIGTTPTTLREGDRRGIAPEPHPCGSRKPKIGLTGLLYLHTLHTRSRVDERSPPRAFPSLSFHVLEWNGVGACARRTRRLSPINSLPADARVSRSSIQYGGSLIAIRPTGKRAIWKLSWSTIENLYE